MIPVAEAISRITGAFEPLAGETVWLGEAVGRVLAEDVVARTTQPPFDVSAMDGDAVRGGEAHDRDDIVDGRSLTVAAEVRTMNADGHDAAGLSDRLHLGVGQVSR